MTNANLQQLIRQAMALQQQGDLQRAKSIYLQVLEKAPRHPDALHLYGLACHQQGDHESAAKYIQQAVEQVPDQPVLRNNLGDALSKAGQFDAAIRQLRIALELQPGFAGAHQNLGTAYLQTGDHDAALNHARKAVQLDETGAAAWFDLGLVLLDHVRLDESAGAFRRALALRPDYPRAATSLLYVLNLLPGKNTAELAAEHLSVARNAFPGARRQELATPANPRVRIGYVSGDLRAHAVNYFFEPVLENHDSGQFEIYCYSNVTQPDRVSARLAAIADHWRDIAAWDDERVIDQIRADNIDILFDLSGHTKHGRLAVFAHKPAPVQVSWLGFPNTTGLTAMDYRVVDHCTAPVSENSGGSEELLRLPAGFACFRPPAGMPGIKAAPCERNGYVTLGCLHKLEKLNDSVIALWADILHQNPQTRLLLVRDQLDGWQRQRLLDQFAALGIDGQRLQMKRLREPRKAFLEYFADIDILLDTFPWSGHTLACCALYSGVPVITLLGNSHAGRMVASVLQSIGLDELIAHDTTAYARKVGELSASVQRLATYRSGLRERFEGSLLRDEVSFTRTLEDACLRILKH